MTTSPLRHELANGLRLIIAPMDSTQTVTVLVLVGTGSRYETREINGISHFLEHLMFKGTAKRPTAAHISQELDSLGADYNAFTMKEVTGYYVKCAAERFPTALDVIADIFQNSKFDAAEIEKERGPVTEEINMYLDKPARYVNDIYEELVFGDQPLGWQVAGTKENVAALQRETFTQYFNDHYVAGNTVIVVAGHCEPATIKAQVEQQFAAVRQGNVPQALSFAEHQKQSGFKVFNKITDQTYVNFGFRAFHRLHPKLEALEVIATILGGGMSSRLFTEVREKRGLAYAVSASTNTYKETGDITAFAGLNNKNLVPALEIIMHEFKRIINEPVSAAELRRVKDYVKGRFAIGLELSDAIASFYADQELLENRLLTPAQRLERIEAVTPADIQAVARELFTAERLNLALIGPFQQDDVAVTKVLAAW